MVKPYAMATHLCRPPERKGRESTNVNYFKFCHPYFAFISALRKKDGKATLSFMREVFFFYLPTPHVKKNEQHEMRIFLRYSTFGRILSIFRNKIKNLTFQGGPSNVTVCNRGRGGIQNDQNQRNIILERALKIEFGFIFSVSTTQEYQTRSGAFV